MATIRCRSFLAAAFAAAFGLAGCAGSGARVGISVPVGIGGVGVSVGTDGRLGGAVGASRGGVGVGVGASAPLPGTGSTPSRGPGNSSGAATAPQQADPALSPGP